MPDLVEKLNALLKSKSWKIATAESCTGGLIAAAITDKSGSSAMFDRGFVTYSNEAKQDLLGVSKQTLDTQGAVSPETAREMVEGALDKTAVDIAVSVTGVAGPTGGTPEKPVGLVYIAAKTRAGDIKIQQHFFKGDRQAVRAQTVDAAFQLLIDIIEDKAA